MFSGHGHVLKGVDNKKGNFYEYIYFLNLNTNKLIEIANEESHL